MIRLKSLLREITDSDLQKLFQKIDTKQFRFLGMGDNGRVYQFENEDKVFKITRDEQEFELAEAIQDKMTEFSTFIPVYWAGNRNGDNIIIMANADQLDDTSTRLIDTFAEKFKTFAYNQGGEVSIFDFLDSGIKIHPVLENFLRALQQDIRKLSIPDLDLDLDFRSDNVMMWSGKMVLVDW